MSELGNLLKKSRKEKKMTLDELQQKTKIQKRYLEAIEQGNFSVLPGDFYTRAFIRTYAEVVGLDGDEIMATYRNELPSIKTEVNATDTTATREKPKKAPREVPAFLLGKGFKIVLAVMVVVIVGALWWMLYNKGQTSTDTVVDKSPATSISIDEANKSGESKVESSSKESESSDSKEDDEDAGDVKISAPDKDSESNVYEIEAPKSAKLKLGASQPPVPPGRMTAWPLNQNKLSLNFGNIRRHVQGRNVCVAQESGARQTPSHSPLPLAASLSPHILLGPPTPHPNPSPFHPPSPQPPIFN